MFSSNPFTPVQSSESEQAQKTQEALQHEVTVTLKLIQVYAMDKKGNPILDLTKDDFILYDNGKLQTITDFEKHLVAIPEKKVEEEILETKLPKAEIPSSRMNRKFILLLDNDRNDAAGVIRSKKAALHFIDTQLQPSDEVGIFSYSVLHGIVVHEYLTSDHKKARESVEKIKGIPGIRPRTGELSLSQERARAESEAKVHLDKGGESGTAEVRQKLPPESQITQLFTSQSGDPNDAVARTNNFIEDLKALAISLRYIPGYKNIILFSGGIQSSLLFAPDQVLREKYEDMGKELTNSNSPVYAVNTLGFRRVQSLQMLSELSGGKYFHNVNDYQKIAEQIQSITSNYYVLGYYVDEAWDGKYHKIEVKLKRKDCQVHAQGGYFNPKPFTEFSDFEKKVHLLDLALSKNPYFQQPSSFDMIALPCSFAKKDNILLLSEIPLDEMQDVVKGKPELVTFIFDDKNSVVDSTKGEIDVSTLPQKTIFDYTFSSLSPGKYECRMIIRNLDTGRAAVASCSVEIPEPLESGSKLFEPLLLIPEKNSFYLKLSKEKNKEAQERELSISDIYSFLTNEHSPLLETIDQGTTKLLAIMRSSVVGIQNPNVELSAFLGQKPEAQKTRLNFSILSSKKDKDTDILFLEFQLPQLKPGIYSLDLVAMETSTQAKSQISRSFQVK